MMTSHIEEPDLHAFLDGELAGAERARIREHLAACADCRARLETMERLFTRIESAPELPLGRDFSPGVLARLPRPQPPPRWILAAALAQVAAAAAILAFVLPEVLSEPAAAAITTDLLAQLESAVSNPEPWGTLVSGPISAVENALLEFQAALAHPDLLLGGLAALLPLAASSTLLWLVGNGVVIRRHTRS